MILVLMMTMFIIRLLFLKISIQNEKRILAEGGKEFGAKKLQILDLASYHDLFFCLNGSFVK